MKKIMSITMIALAIMLFGAVAVYAGEQVGTPVTHSKDFERMKELVGVWEGKSDMGKGTETLRITYELTSAGNAIVERFDAGTPHEMIAVYYDYGGKLAMTHYCSLGNQPHMELSNPGAVNLRFILSKKMPGLVSTNEMHMHALIIALNDKDSITQTWTLYDKGAKKSDVVVNLLRVNR
jgi:hypothetical protein